MTSDSLSTPALFGNPTYETHPLADLFPAMSETEYTDLREDIRANGLLEPIWLADGKIIDGRHRFRACQELSITPRFREWDGTGSLVELVVSLNLHRRHLTSSQKAMIGVEIERRLGIEARQQQGTRTDLFQIFEKSPEPIHAAKQAAQLVGTNHSYIVDAKHIAERAPELVEQVKSGKLSLPEAKKISVLPPMKRNLVIERVQAGDSKTVNQAVRKVNNDEKQARPLPATKFRVIYADPPWEYNNSGFEQSAAEHYPTMSTADICDLPIHDLADPDSVLFLWATSPLLPDAFKVLQAWGATYKASIVWDKGKAPGMGWFVQTQHEFLLIATWNGNLHPKDRPASVVRELTTEHSRKPDSFYGMIESMYSGPYIELFSRRSRENWTVWGNENGL